MKQPDRKRIAVIGLGDIAQKAYLPLVACHPAILPVLCTRNKETLQRIALQYRISETYTDLGQLILSRPDAAMVHTATESHYSIVRQLLKAGIPVLVDKPLSYSLEECEELLNLSVQTRTLLYVGFNRRFAPFIQQIQREKHPVQVSWQKHRANLPGDPRVFVFDDFIHVVDSLLFLGDGLVEELNVRTIRQNKLLSGLQVEWRQRGTLLQGSMNRISGYTQELVDYYTEGNTWHIDDFTTCSHFHDERHELYKAASWDSALRKKGFYHLIEDWLQALSEPSFNEERVKAIRLTHQLCEQIVQQVLQE